MRIIDFNPRGRIDLLLQINDGDRYHRVQSPDSRPGGLRAQADVLAQLHAAQLDAAARGVRSRMRAVVEPTARQDDRLRVARADRRRRSSF